jgi:hypothetical protein
VNLTGIVFFVIIIMMISIFIRGQLFIVDALKHRLFCIIYIGFTCFLMLSIIVWAIGIDDLKVDSYH